MKIAEYIKTDYRKEHLSPKDKECFRACLSAWYDFQEKALEDEWRKLEKRGVENSENWIGDDYVAYTDKEDFITTILEDLGIMLKEYMKNLASETFQRRFNT